MLFIRFLMVALFGCAAASHAFTGSDSCKNCHAQEHANWQGSHHDLAMQLPTPATVLGDFNDASFTYNRITTRFFRDGDKFMVRTDGEDGKLTDFQVSYVFGVYPLQQYLLPLSRGRLQAMSVAWDARPQTEGGQRWYHLYPQEVIDHKDPLHWTGPYQNWNTRCAECHSTDVKKNYDAVSRSFNTTFAELDVGCEACHGPGE
ncbi:MAG: multiheme c-type cytochrome, partial [Halioglobus sp.]